MAKGKCPVCNRTGYLQILNNGRYARMRHYEKMVNCKPVFSYHQISINEADEISRNSTLINRSGFPLISQASSNDLENHNSASNSQMAGGVGFEPTTPNLGGWCSVRTEPHSTRYPPRGHSYPY